MSYNILSALAHFVENPTNVLDKPLEASSNRASSMGDMLESFVKRFLCDGFDIKHKIELLDRYSESFSYTGGVNNPPDIMYRGGDAFEVKKIESLKGQVPLNSSFPKNKLYVTDSKISQECVTCEEWTEKDIFYAIGYVKGCEIRHLWFVHGECYAANKNCYERILNAMTEGVSNLDGVELSPTNEIARVNTVDPLKITYLRVRGMWGIVNPTKLYDYVYTPSEGANFTLAVLMTSEKYNKLKCSMGSEFPAEIEQSNVKIQNPNNPVDRISAELLVYNSK